MNTLFLIIVATFIISLLAFLGVVFLFLKDKALQKVTFVLVSLAAGALMGGAFLHLIPEAVEEFDTHNIFYFVLIGFIGFFLLEKVLHWRHCHKQGCKTHSFAYVYIFGNIVHNFIDGLIVAASFLVDIRLGVITAIAVALHEIPQEISDFGVLVYAGFHKVRALFINFFIALTTILGGIIGFYLSSYIEDTTLFLIPFAAGAFIYIAASDLIPEIKKEDDLKKSLLGFSVFVFGIFLIYLAELILH